MDDQQTAQPDNSWTQACAREIGVSEETVIEVVGWYEEYFSESAAKGGNGVGVAKLFRWLLLKKEKHLAIKAAAYALGLDEEINFKKPSDIAREHGCQRENVRKMVNDIQLFLSLPLREEQRTEESKRKMSKTRRGQLEAYSGVCMTLGDTHKTTKTNQITTYGKTA